MYNREELISFVDKALDEAQNGRHHIHPFAFSVPGMTTQHIQRVLNNLMGAAPVKYIEVGTFAGAMLCAALSNNPGSFGYGVDNFSQFGGNADGIVSNLKQSGVDWFKFLDKPSLTVTKEDIPDLCDIFMYDADHQTDPTKENFLHYLQFMNNTFIYLADDYDDRYHYGIVRRGVELGLAESGVKVHKEWKMAGFNDSALWWNGLYVAVLEKGN